MKAKNAANKATEEQMQDDYYLDDMYYLVSIRVRQEISLGFQSVWKMSTFYPAYSPIVDL